MNTADPRDARIAELKRLQSAALARISEQEARIAELEARLRRTSRNSSKPSSDPPGTPPRKSEPTGRKPGGQPGHKGYKGERLPPDQVNAVVAVPVPERCALLPAGVPLGNFGPRLTGFIALCTVRFRLSKRLVQKLLEDVLGAELGLGSVSNLEQTVSQALAAPVQEAREYVPTQPSVHQDETDWWQKHVRAWLWVASTAAVAGFRILKSRGKAVAASLSASSPS